MNNDYENYVCADCFHKLNECTCGTKPWYLIQIDPMIQDTVRILNEKGYFTQFCCEGHEVGGRMYIKFSVFWDFDMMPNCKIPEGFKYNKKDKILLHDFMDDADYAKKIIYAERLLDWAMMIPEQPKGLRFY